MSEQMNEDRMQVKCNYDDGMMHIQGVTSTMCEGMNRKYGYAERMQCQKGVSDWLKMQTKTGKGFLNDFFFVFHVSPSGFLKFFEVDC